jgi:hypothetical protein
LAIPSQRGPILPSDGKIQKPTVFCEKHHKKPTPITATNHQNISSSDHPNSTAITCSAHSSLRMSSITPHINLPLLTIRRPIERRRKQKRILLSAVVLSCIFLLGEHQSAGAVESALDRARKRTPSSSKSFAFLRKNTLAFEELTMRTRSGARYRGGAAVDENPEIDTPAVADSKPSALSEPTEALQAVTPPATDSISSAVITSDTEVSKATETKKAFTWRDARRTLFPIHGKDEVHKFLLIGSIKFFIIMALTLTRDTKDTLVVTQCGAEAIAFLKVSRLQGFPIRNFRRAFT